MATPVTMPGMPTPASLSAAAAQAANTAVPTVKSIQNQYGQSMTDAAGFARALVSILRGVGTAGDAGYGQAIGQQQAIDQEAANRLSALGSPYAAGSAASVGAGGDSSLGRLLQDRAAFNAYASQLPAEGAGRGAVALDTLRTNLQTALQTRSQDYQKAFQEAYATAQSNAAKQAEAMATLGLRQDQLSMEAQNYANENAYRMGELGLNEAKFRASLGVSGSGVPSSFMNGVGGLKAATGLTANEINTSVGKAMALLNGKPETTKYISVKNAGGQITGYRQVAVAGSGSAGAVQAGVPFSIAVQQLENQGIMAQIALYATAKLYASARPLALRGQPQAYTAYATFVKWAAENGLPGYAQIWNRMNAPNPGSQVAPPNH